MEVDFESIKRCKRCESTDTVIERKKTSSGNKVIAVYCRRCRQEVKVILDPDQNDKI